MATGMSSADRFRCVAEAAGGIVVGRRIPNKAALIIRYRPDVFSFAHPFYLKGHELATDTAGVMLLQLYSNEITETFFDWVEANL